MNYKEVLTTSVIFLLLGFSSDINAQNKSINGSSSSIVKLYTDKKKNNKTSWEIANQRSKSGDAYQFMALRRDFGFINEMLYSGDHSVIEFGLSLINNLMESSEQSSSIKNNKTFRDKYKGWVTLYNNSERYKEVPLYESYSFFYIAQFLNILKDIGWVDESNSNAEWWDSTLGFIEENIWNKWLERSKSLKNKDYWYFLRQRTHMGSHWAGIAMYLGAMTKKEEIKAQTKEVQRQYDLLLKRNLKIVNNAYVWNATYDNIKGTDASGTNKQIIQDVSHGNHVVAYILSAYEFGNPNWTKEDIKKLSNTFKNITYDKRANKFSDNVDGASDGRRPGWGNFVADGWAKLASYDNEVKEILVKFGKTEMIGKYYQNLQYESTMFKSNSLKNK